MVKKFKNLALQGGGVWGITYAGAIDELERQGVLQHIQRVAGTSAGSIVALLVALRYTGAEIRKVLEALDYARFLDGGKIDQVARQYGYYKSNFANELFRGWVQEKLGSEKATFTDLTGAGCLDLRVYATNLNTRQIFEFSQHKTPNVALADAVRASMSIPLFFTAVEIERRIYVDGGAVFDYPIMGFGKDEIENTLGLAFAQSASVAREDADDGAFGFNQPLQYIRRLVNVLERVQSPVFALDDGLQQNTILIDTGEVNSLDFKVSAEKIEMLIANGRKAVKEYFGEGEG
jgi:NTE family protein